MTRIIAKSGTLSEIGNYCNQMFGPAAVRISDKKKRKIWAMRIVGVKENVPTKHPWLNVDIVNTVTKDYIEVSFRNKQHATMFQLRWA